MTNARPRRLLTVSVLSLVLGCSAACVSSGEGLPHAGVVALWRELERLPAERALAIAGDPERIWVGAAVGDAPTQPEADRAALAECQKRRIVGRIQDPCRLYARGLEVVWTPPGQQPPTPED